MDYRREIDGLRAVAVLPVILFHAGFESFSGGFVGVDVFFVISGYLITTIILAELEQEKFSIINFYERRARRILPALFLIMLFCVPFAWFWLLPTHMKDFSKELVTVSVFASNILFWRENSYFGTAAELKPLLHTWSLAIEEQYYVLFPLFLMLFWKLGKRWILITLGLLFVGSLIVAQWGSYAKPAAAFYLLPTRGWELLIGAFAAFYLSQKNRKEFRNGLSEFGGWLGVVLIIYAVFNYSKATPFPGFYALVPTLGAVLIILFATQQTSVGKFIGNKAFVGIGLISYSAYLWHQPLFAFARQSSLTKPSNAIFLTLSILSLILAYTTWKYVENPFRNRKNFSRKQVFIFSGAFTAFFILMGAFLYSDNGNISKRFNQDEQEVLLLGQKNYKETLGVYDLGRCFLDYEQKTQVLIDSNCVSLSKNTDNKKPRVIVFGDSLAAHWMSGVKHVFESDEYSVEQWTAVSCRSIDHSKITSRCKEFYEKFISDVLPLLRPVDKVIMSSHWTSILNDEGKKAFLDSLDNTFNLLNKTGASVIVIGKTPSFNHNPFKLIFHGGHSKSHTIFFKSFNFLPVNNLLKSSTQKFNFDYYSPADVICKSDQSLDCLVKLKGRFLYFDSGHLSVDGSKYVFERLNMLNNKVETGK